jgi:hypothetical protein
VLISSSCLAPRSVAQPAPDTTTVRLDGGRFSVLATPADRRLARSLLAAAVARDTFPGLGRQSAHVVIAVAPDIAHFRAWTGPSVPEWGAAVAFPESERVVIQGGAATSAAGDPIAALRHELAHLALHEYLGGFVPRWFDEGYASYAAGEGVRDDVLATNVALALRGVPSLSSLDTGLVGGEGQAAVSYALAYRAVADLAALDRAHGLSLFFKYWRESGSLDVAVRRAYGETLDAFEVQWRAQTRRRYGALALMTDLTFVTVVFLALLLPLYLSRRRRDRARLAALRASEASDVPEASDAIRPLQALESTADSPSTADPGGAGG